MADENDILEVLVKFKFEMQEAVREMEETITKIKQTGQEAVKPIEDAATKASDGIKNVKKESDDAKKAEDAQNRGESPFKKRAAELNEAGGAARFFKEGLMSLASPLLRLSSAVAVISELKHAIKEASEEEVAVRQLSAMFEAAGANAEPLLKMFQKYLPEIQNFGFQVTAAYTSLKTFSGVLSDPIKAMEATAFAAKFAAASNMSLESASMQLSRTLQSGYVPRFGQAAIVLRSVRDEITKAGSASERLDIIMAKSGKQMEAMADAGMTGFKRLTSAAQEFSESIGKMLLPIAEPMANFFAKFLRDLIIVDNTVALWALRAEEFATGWKFTNTAAEYLTTILENQLVILKSQVEALKAHKAGILELILTETKRAQLIKQNEAEIEKKTAELGRINASPQARAEAQKIVDAQLAQNILSLQNSIKEMRGKILASQLASMTEEDKREVDRLQRQIGRDETAYRAMLGKRMELVERFSNQEAALIRENSKRESDLAAEDMRAALERSKKFTTPTPLTFTKSGAISVSKGRSDEAIIDDMARGKTTVEEFSGTIGVLAENYSKWSSEIDRAVAARKKQIAIEYQAEQSLADNDRKNLERRNRAMADMSADAELQRQMISERLRLGQISIREAAEQSAVSRRDEAKKVEKEISDLQEKYNQASLSGLVSEEGMALAAHQIDQLKLKLLTLQESLEEMAAHTDSVWTGIALGVERISNKVKTGAQVAAAAMEELADGMSNAFAESFVEMIRGTKSFAESFQQMTAEVLADIAKMIAKEAVLGMIKMAMGSASGGGSGIMGLFSGLLGGGAGAVAGGGGDPSAPYEAEGGIIHGGTPGRDSVPAVLMPGEFVHPTRAVDYYGKGVMESMRRLEIPKDVFGKVRVKTPPTPRFSFAEGGAVTTAMAGQQQPVILRNILAIGPDHLNRIASSSENQRAIRTYISDHPEVVESALNRRRRSA